MSQLNPNSVQVLYISQSSKIYDETRKIKIKVFNFFFSFPIVTEPQQSICGNGVVEPGEQCDCGWEEDCKDSCCYPMSRHPNYNEKPCTLTPR